MLGFADLARTLQRALRAPLEPETPERMAVEVLSIADVPPADMFEQNTWPQMQTAEPEGPAVHLSGYRSS